MADIVQALSECLEAMRQGRDLEACLERYPQYRSELKALLDVVARIRPLSEEVAPSPAVREVIRARIFEASRAPRGRRLPRGPHPVGRGGR